MLKSLTKISVIATLLLLSGCGSGSSNDAPKSDTTEVIGDNTTDTTNENSDATTDQKTDTNTTSDTTNENSDTTTNQETNTDDTSTDDSSTSTDNNSDTTSLLAANEPYYKYLWHIDSLNSSNLDISSEVSRAFGGEYEIGAINKDADINILEAWKITKGANVRVAVIDDGADINHEDLKDNIYKAYNADDDTNDISNKSNDISHASHGNTCAGFIAAPINEKGTIGSAPESKLIAIAQNESSDAKTIIAFEYAKNNGAKVISCSWGTENVSESVVDEIKSLYDAGITVLFASGNDGKSLDTSGLSDESEIEWVIGVGASGENNDVTSYSNYGANIDVLSPGGDSEMSVGLLGLDDSGTQGSTDNYGLVSNNYSFGMGTSFATPVAAGVVALMYSVNPNITPAQVKKILIDTADKIGGTAASYNNGFDEKRAYGKINAYKAVLEAQKLLN